MNDRTRDGDAYEKTIKAGNNKRIKHRYRIFIRIQTKGS